MNITVSNPWQWQDSFGYAQSVEVKHNSGTLYCSGQGPVDAEGRPVDGTMEEQLIQTLKNIEEVIVNAGYNPSGIVRLNYYTTSIPEFFEAYGILMAWLAQFKIAPASTLLEVKALAMR